LEGAYNHGKSKEKEEFCKEIRCAEAATGPQGSSQKGPPSVAAAGGFEKARAWHEGYATLAEIQTTDHGVARDSAGTE
jgi:hypothetical protein